MEKILITGGMGLIGSELVKYALNETDNEIYVVDNLSSGRETNLSNIDKSLKDRLTIKIMDVVDPKELELIEFNPSIIYHLASRASPADFIDYPIDILKTNSIGTNNILKIARICKSKFILASTSEIYGDPKQHPQTEEYYGNVNPIGLRSCYDEGKRFAEALTAAYRRKFNVNTVIVRLFNTYGPNLRKDDGRVISTFINQALNNEPLSIYDDGNQTRSFCYIDDIVSGLYQIGMSKNTNGGVFNLGSPEEVSIKELANIIISISQSPSKLIYKKSDFIDEPKNRNPDISKIQSTINWKPKYALREGLELTIKKLLSQ